MVSALFPTPPSPTTTSLYVGRLSPGTTLVAMETATPAIQRKCCVMRDAAIDLMETRANAVCVCVCVCVCMCVCVCVCVLKQRIKRTCFSKSAGMIHLKKYICALSFLCYQNTQYYFCIIINNNSYINYGYYDYYYYYCCCYSNIEIQDKNYLYYYYYYYYCHW